VHQLPNLITLLRCVLIVPTAWAVGTGRPVLAFGLFLAAGISDGVDGWLARRFDWRSRFGAVADPLADKLMVAVIYVALALETVLPVWLAALVVLRDVVILGGALAWHVLVGRLELAPTRLGKLNTAMHVVFVGGVLATRTGPPLESFAVLIDPGVWLIAALTIVSGGHYVWVWSGYAADRRAES
jgi:cardiolipin synthase